MFILFFILITASTFAHTLTCSQGYTPYQHEIWTAGRNDATHLQTDLLTLSGEPASIDIEKIWTYDTSKREQIHEQFKIIFTDENGSRVYAQTTYSDDVNNTEGAEANTYTDLGMILLPKGVKKAKLIHRADPQYGEDLHHYNSVTFKGLCYKLNSLKEEEKQSMEIGDFVWLDLNRDGIQNDNETGLSDIKIELYHQDKKLAETISDEYGHYEFKGLKPDIYKLKFIIKEGWAITKKDSGQNSQDLFDSDADAKGIIRVRQDKDQNAYDVGLYLKPRAKLELDINTSLKDIENAIVGDLIMWRYTVKNRGNIKLSDIELRDQLEGDILCPKRVLFANEQMFCTKESIVENGFNGNQLIVEADLPSGEVVIAKRETYYIGKESLDYQGSIGDRVWLDINQNGIQESGEAGISGIEVILYDQDNQQVASMQTNENGNYFFEKLKPSQYHLKVIIPKGYSMTEQHQDDGNSTRFRLGVAENIADKDFGLYRK